jgi:Flp pilus assembly protein CpaB
VKPGDRVDILTIIQIGNNKENRVVKTLLQDVVVLAVGHNVTNNVARVLEKDLSGNVRARSLTEDSTFATVTLEVEPAQAQMIALALSNNETPLTLSLRNNDDSDRVNLESYTIGDILGSDATKLRAPARSQ